MNVNDVKNDYKNLFGTICFIPFLKTGAFQYLLPKIDVLMDIWMVLVFFYLSFLWIYNIKKVYDSLFFLLFLFFICNLLSTIINKGNYWGLCSSFLKLFAMYFYIEVMILERKVDWKCILLPLDFLFVLNVVLWFLYPHGMYTMLDGKGSFFSNDNWILGGKNAYFYYILFAIVIRLLKDYSNSLKLGDFLCRNWLACILYLINAIFISKSATGGIGVILVLFYLLLDKKQLFKSPKLFYSVIFFLFFFFVFIVIIGDSQIMSNFTHVLGKNETFATRTIIWALSIKAIILKPIFGYGFEDAVYTVQRINQSTSHNKYLWIMYRGGLLSVVVFGYIVFKAFINMHKILFMRLFRILMWIIIVILITWLTEVYDNNVFIFAIFNLCVCSPKMLKSMIAIENNAR